MLHFHYEENATYEDKIMKNGIIRYNIPKKLTEIIFVSYFKMIFLF